MKDKECIHCERLFDCKGKPTKEPCLMFKSRHSDNERGDTDGKAKQ